MSESRIQIWNKHFEEPQTIEFEGAAIDLQGRFEDVCASISEGLADGAPMVFHTWSDVAGGQGITLEPDNIVKVEAHGLDVDLLREFGPHSSP
ncbi:MAG: hypothetical protein ABR604_09265 [Jatrophihabitantaceae bacterium]